MTDAELQKQIDNLQSEIKPSRDLWPGIEHALEHQRQTAEKPKSIKPYAFAASLALAMLLTWKVDFNKSEVVAKVSAIDTLTEQYDQHKQTMLVSFGRPDLTALPIDMQKQFADLQAARESLLTALKDDPENANLLNLLQWTQQQELNLLEQIYTPKWQTI